MMHGRTVKAGLILVLVSLASLVSVSVFGVAQQVVTPGEEMAAAAGALLASMDHEQREPAVFMMDSEERMNWHYVPRRRGGFRITEMTSAQKEQAVALVATGLSEHGQQRIKDIRWLDRRLTGGRDSSMGEDVYYFSFFQSEGLPGTSLRADYFAEQKTWGWRMEGHHISLNFAIKDGEIVSVFPLFMGADPATVGGGERKGFRALKEEEGWARDLFKSLSAEQKSKALISATAPRDIVTRNSVVADIGPAVGVPYADMNPDQQHLLGRIVHFYAGRLRKELSLRELDKIQQAGLGKIHFAWAGGDEPGQGHYYRIHGPTFLIEYDNTQGGANHIHTVWRDLENDFGRDLLAEHYARARHHQ